jgi:hypothetical protein
MAERRFTLEKDNWYAADFIADDVPGSMEGGYGYSPIYVLAVHPCASGKRIFDLKFFCLNYPEGVQEKEYNLKTVHRGESFILAHTVDPSSIRFLCIHEITETWMRKHFHIDKDTSVEDWLKRHSPQGIKSHE